MGQLRKGSDRLVFIPSPHSHHRPRSSTAGPSLFMNWTTIGIAVASAVAADLHAYQNAWREWEKQDHPSDHPMPKFRFDLLAIRAAIGFLTGVVGAQLPTS